jgi:hypothetical protein
MTDLKRDMQPLCDFAVYLAYQSFLSGLKCWALTSCKSFMVAYIKFLFCVNLKQEQEIATPEAQCLTNL